MISRKSTKLLAEAYHEQYYSVSNYAASSYPHHLRITELYDFLYEEEYDAWFLNSVNGIRKSYQNKPRDLIEFLMKLHTGESLVSATRGWEWTERQKLGQRYLKDLAQDLIKKWSTQTIDDCFDNNQLHARRARLKALVGQLELDGYIYKEGLLYQVDSSVIDEQEEQSFLESLVDQLSLSDNGIIKHHIKNAEEHYVNGKWDDSIANSRKFLEAILAQVAAALNLKKYAVNISPAKLSKPFEIRDYLERETLIETKEKDAIAKVYGLLSGTGSHPYIAEKDQARLMWHLALTFSQFVLLRYDGYLKSNP